MEIWINCRCIFYLHLGLIETSHTVKNSSVCFGNQENLNRDLGMVNFLMKPTTQKKSKERGFAFCTIFFWGGGRGAAVFFKIPSPDVKKLQCKHLY